MSQSERHEFQAEVRQLLDLMVHSLYSDKDIFLRELISNASDALDKLRFEALTKAELGGGPLEITLSADKDKRTLTIADTGIGMTRDEVIKNIGTIARSGTKEFLATLKEANAAQRPELIGQFGVGFYSAFMVADTIELVTRRAGSDTAVKWTSTGDGAYTLEDATRESAGTTITLHLKPADTDANLRDYTQDAVLREIVKRYSDFVAYPIKLGSDTLNSMKAIWDRPKSEVTEDEYKEFYKHIARDWTDPLRTIPVKMEGTIEAYALLYVPAKAPFDLYSPEMKRGVQLYVKRVFVMDECKELMPTHLRFIKGVVDAHDLSLNVSREILQKDRQIATIRKQLVKKVLGTLEEMKRDKFDEYLEFWAQFGPVMKEGLANYDTEQKDKLLELVVAHSTHEGAKLVSLDDYVGRMKEGQDAIYFLSGTSLEAAQKSPLLESFRAKGIEVLLFADPVDEFWLDHAPRFKDKPLVSIAKGDIALGSQEERDAAKAELEKQQTELSDVLVALRVALQEDVKEVRLSSRLTASAACIVSDEHDLSPRLAKLLERVGQSAPAAKPILEVNPKHELFAKLQRVVTESKADPRIATIAKVLLGQAQLADAGAVPDPVAFGQALTDLMLRAV